MDRARTERVVVKVEFADDAHFKVCLPGDKQTLHSFMQMVSLLVSLPADLSFTYSVSCMAHHPRTRWCAHARKAVYPDPACQWNKVHLKFLSCCDSNFLLIRVGVRLQDASKFPVSSLRAIGYLLELKYSNQIEDVSSVDMALSGLLDRNSRYQPAVSSSTDHPRNILTLLGSMVTPMGFCYPDCSFDWVAATVSVEVARSSQILPVPDTHPANHLPDQLQEEDSKCEGLEASQELAIALQSMEFHAAQAETTRRVRLVALGAASPHEFDDDLHCSAYSLPLYRDLIGVDVTTRIPAWHLISTDSSLLDFHLPSFEAPKKGLENNVLENFPRGTIPEGCNQVGRFNQKSCSICLEEWNSEHELIELPCGHIYHKDCVQVWLKKSVKCPLDNLNILDMVKPQVMDGEQGCCGSATGVGC